MAIPTIQWPQVGTAVAAIGSLGVAAFGITESFGKALAWSRYTKNHEHKHFGLPYVGLSQVFKMIKPFEPALLCSYGENYKDIIAQQYRTNRDQGPAADTIRQGVRLGLPFLTIPVATQMIDAVWDIGTAYSTALATALQVGAAPPPPAPGTLDPQTLVGRFSAALDARINAAFQDASDKYETAAKTWAAWVAIAMCIIFNYGMVTHKTWQDFSGLFPWPIALGIGFLAVPLAPVAKDLSTSLQNAATAFKSISGRP